MKKEIKTPLLPIKVKGLIFDLDGTLLNTIDDLSDSINKSMRHFAYPSSRGPNEYKMIIGAGARDHIQKSMPEKEAQNEEQVDLVFEFYKKQYARSWKNQTKLYEGIPELLDEVAKLHLPFSIFTNKPHEFTLEMTDYYLKKWPFHSILGASEKFKRKPSPEGALYLAQEMNCKNKEILFIGDSNIDILTAKASGMISVGVTWGFRPKEELIEAQADFIIDHPMELLSLILND